MLITDIVALDGELAQAEAALQAARGALRAGAAPDLIAGELRLAAARLGEVTGQGTSEIPPEVLDGIFAQFCVGK